ncbi:MAG: site-2 protease family protein [Clostridiales bacterium]|nr:site-2 protease family protein [Clostridiales bacterium]
MSILAAVLLFGFIVLVHEFGHFILAKGNGIAVLEFSVGMGPRLATLVKEGGSYRLKLFARAEKDGLTPPSEDTCYSWKLFPFGGSCMMMGEDSSQDDPRAFHNKPVLARILVIAAGPVFNFILAFLFAMVLVAHSGHDFAVIYAVTEDSAALQAGLQAGDKITGINSRRIEGYRDVLLYTYSHPGDEMVIRYQRPVGGSWENGGAAENRTVTLTPKYSEEYGSYLIGVQFAGYEKVDGIGDILYYSLYEIRYCIQSTIDSIGMLARGTVRANEAVAGPVGIVTMVGETVEEGSEAGVGAVLLILSNWILLLSSSLGIMNLLPIPALDGGRLLFLFVELIRGKPVNPEMEGRVHLAGMMLLMALMVLILFNDISRIL